MVLKMNNHLEKAVRILGGKDGNINFINKELVTKLNNYRSLRGKELSDSEVALIIFQWQRGSGKLGYADMNRITDAYIEKALKYINEANHYYTVSIDGNTYDLELKEVKNRIAGVLFTDPIQEFIDMAKTYLSDKELLEEYGREIFGDSFDSVMSKREFNEAGNLVDGGKFQIREIYCFITKDDGRIIYDFDAINDESTDSSPSLDETENCTIVSAIFQNMLASIDDIYASVKSKLEERDDNKTNQN